MKQETIQPFGAGLCGGLLSIVLARRGYDVTVYERQKDSRKADTPAGRSINLAMSARGIHALKHAGIFSRVEPLLVPMRGRFVHHEDGSTELQAYGRRPDEQIYSVSRGDTLRGGKRAQSDPVGASRRNNARCGRNGTDRYRRC